MFLNSKQISDLLRSVLFIGRKRKAFQVAITRIDGKFRPVLTFLLLTTAFFAFFLLFSIQQVQAAKSSSGKLLFFPCDKCHPPGKELPVGFKKHEIRLEAHDKLGQGNSACFVCHQSVENPALLRLADGGFVNIDGDISKVCYRCHPERYDAWKKGMHGKQPGCTAKGCHNPHSPAWIAISPLPPFLGTTYEVKVAGSGRKPFQALPIPPEDPNTPSLPATRIAALVAVLGAAVFIGGSIYVARSGLGARRRNQDEAD